MAFRAMRLTLVQRGRGFAAAKVFGARYWFKMIGIHAGSHAAQVIKLQPFRNRTAKQLPSGTVRQTSSTLELGFAIVRSCINRSKPKPATAIRLRGNSLQEVFCQGCRIGGELPLEVA